MHDLTAVVTGANSGIRLETARGLSKAGYRTILLCRDPERAAGAKADIDASHPSGHTEIVLGDLSSQASLEAAASEIAARADRLDVLVNNAGISLRDREVTVDGRDRMLAVNHLAPFLLTDRLLPMLSAAPEGRIVNVASEAHRLGAIDYDDLDAERGYGFLGMSRYCETKLMNVLFTTELARRLEGTSVTANCLHPGAVRTNLGDPPAPVRALVGLFFLSAARGARTSIAAATDEAFAGRSGHYLVRERIADRRRSKAGADPDEARRLWEATESLL